MSEPEKSLIDALVEAIRAVVREEIGVLNQTQAPAGTPIRQTSQKKTGQRTPADGLLRLDAVAAKLGLSRSTVRRMIAEGGLPAKCLRSGRRKKTWGVDPADLSRWIRDRGKKKVEDPNGSMVGT